MPFCPNCGTQYVELPPRCGCGYLFGATPQAPPVSVPVPEAAPQPGYFDFTGEGPELLMLYVKTFFLTLVTLGIYSFWGRTEIRKFYWRNTKFAGHAFEYHGTGMELFIGWLKVAGVFLVYVALVTLLMVSMGQKESAWLLILIYLPGLILVPLAIHGAVRYRASRTTWQGRRFVYAGKLEEMIRIVALGLILSVVTLSLYTPFFLVQLRKYIFENLWYGGQKFSFTGEGGDLLWPYVKFLLLFFPTLTLYRFWFQAKQDNYCWEKTSFAGAPFRSTINGGTLLLYTFGLGLAAIFTLGIAVPFVMCAQTKYVFSNLQMTVLPNVRLTELGQDQAGGFGDVLGEALGTGDAIGDGFGL